MKTSNAARSLFLVLFAFVFSCSPGEEQNRQASADKFEDEETTVPSNISGAFLTYERADIRCSQVSLDQFNHEITCSLVEKLSDGLEIKPSQIELGLDIAWNNSLSSDSDFFEIKSCSISEDNLSMSCSVKTAGKLVKVTASALLEKNNSTKTTSANILLPYSVGVSAGYMPLFPYGYVAEAQEQTTASLFFNTDTFDPNLEIDISKEKILGLQKQTISSQYLEDIRGGCEIAGKTYVFGSHLVYRKSAFGLELVLGTKDVYFLPKLKALNYDPLKTPVNFAKSIAFCLNNEIYARSGDTTIAFDPETNTVRYLPNNDFGEIRDLLAVPDITGKDYLLFPPEALSAPSAQMFILFEGETFDFDSTRSVTAAATISSVQPRKDGGWVVFYDDQSTMSYQKNEAGGVTMSIDSFGVGDYSGAWGSVTAHNPVLTTQLEENKYLVYSNELELISLYDASVDPATLTPLVGMVDGITEAVEKEIKNLNFLYAIDSGTVYFGSATSLYRYKIGEPPVLLSGRENTLLADESDSREIRLGVIEDLVYGTNDEVFFVDNSKHAILKLTRGGKIVRIAGTGVLGESPDGTAALEASFGELGEIKLMENGEIYFAESSRHVIRKIDVDGNIQTVVGVLDTYGTSIDDASSNLTFPYNIEVNSLGDIYFTQIHSRADDGNVYATGSIRKWTKATGAISTLTSTVYGGTPNIAQSIGKNISGFYGYPTSMQLIEDNILALGMWMSSNYGGLIKLNLTDLTVGQIAGATTPGSLVEKDYTNPDSFIIGPSSFAYMDINNIYVANLEATLKFLLKINADPSEGEKAVTEIFGRLLNEDISCGEGEHKGYTRDSTSANALRMSLSNICEGGVIRKVAVSNNCKNGEESYKISFVQSFESQLDENSDYSHIVEAEIPCHTSQGGI